MEINNKLKKVNESFSHWVNTSGNLNDESSQKAFNYLQYDVEQLCIVALQNDMADFSLVLTFWLDMIETRQRNPLEKDHYFANDFLWLNNAQKYVQDPIEQKNIECLLTALPLSSQKELQHLIAHNGVIKKDLQTTDLTGGIINECDHILYDLDQSISSNMTVLEFLSREIINARPVMQGWIDDFKINGSAHDVLNTNQYTEQLNNFSQLAKAADLNGISHLCQYQIDRINHVLQEGFDDNVHFSSFLEALGKFPELLNAIVSQPNNDEACLSLLSFLQKDDIWADKLAYSKIKMLFSAVISDLEFGSGNLEKQSNRVLTEDDVSLDVSINASKNMVDSFFFEVPSLIDELTSVIAGLHDDVDVSKHSQKAQRLCHTIKGSAI